MSSTTKILGRLGFAALCASSLSGVAWASEPSVNRYPFDPACAWGRLADGRGMIIRCLTEAEVSQLATAKPNVPGVAVAQPAAAKPNVPNAAPTAVSAETTEKKNGTEPVAGPLEADVVSVTADEGNLPVARRKLRTPREKYAKCVTDNGGLTAEVGEVTVRFLVRELARAEGTSVEKRHGMSDAAAKCVAAVVDRRPVGTPEGPMVGATAVIRVTKQARPHTGVTSGR